MKLIFALLVLLLCGTAGAHVMARQQAEKPRFSEQDRERLVRETEQLTEQIKAKAAQDTTRDSTAYDNFREPIYRPSSWKQTAALEARLDSLEAKIGRAHVVAVQDSEYVKVETFITGSFNEDAAPLRPVNVKWQWGKRVRYIISFEPEK